MKMVWSVFCVITLAVPASAQSPVDGKWEALFTKPRGGQTLIVFDLKSDGQKVSGTMTSRSGSQQNWPIKIQDGKLRIDTLTFSTVYTLPLLQQRFLTTRQIADWITHLGTQSNTITGAVKNDMIEFTQQDWTGRHKVFQAKKVR